MTIQQLFKYGMNRDIPELLPPPSEFVGFDLGSSGIKKMEGCTALGLPDWNFPRDPIPAEDETVDVIYAFHFLEHLAGEDAIKLLREAERVMKVGAVMNICVPYYTSSMQAHDLTHKSVWNEATFGNLFGNDYYDVAGRWKLKVHAQFIMGVVERNIALIAQLVKEA